MSAHRRKVIILSIVLILIAVFQSWGVLQVAREELPKIRGTIGQSSLWRSANFAQSQKFADYVSFLIENIPSDARVVLPPSEIGPWSLAMTPYMQFYLAPREVVNCASLSTRCDVDFQESTTFTLIIDEFPGQLIDLERGKTAMFNDNWGIYQPINSSATSYTTLPRFQHIFEILISAITPMIWLVILGICGYMLSEILLPDETAVLKASLGYGLALSVFTLSLALISLLGIPLIPFVYWIIPSLAMMALGLILYRCFKRSSTTNSGLKNENHKKKPFTVDVWSFIIAIFAALAMLISIGKSYHTTDAILLWGARGYGIAASESIRNVIEWGTSTMPYPLHIPLLLSAFKTISGDVLPMSKILFSGYYLMIILAVYDFLQRTKISRMITGLLSLIFALAPLVFNHATIGYANLTMAYYIVCGLLVLDRYVKQEIVSNRDPKLIIPGLFFVGAAWTRPEGLAITWLMMISIAVITLRNNQLKLKLKAALYFIGPLLAFTVFWMILKPLAYPYPTTNAHIAEDAISSILNGILHIDQLGYILSSFIQSVFALGTWGTLGILTTAMFILSIFYFKRITWSSQPLLIGGLIYIIAVSGIYYLASYDTVHDISWWVNSGLDRLMMPGVILCWVGCVSAVLPHWLNPESLR